TAELSATASLGAVLYGVFDFADVLPLRAAISVPGLELTVGLDDEVPVDLGEVMANLLGKLTGSTFEPPALGMSLARFEFGTSLRSGGFSLLGDVLTDWSLPLGSFDGQTLATLSLDEIAVQLEYEESELAAVLNAKFSLAGAGFYVEASTPGGEDAGWTLAAG